ISKVDTSDRDEKGYSKNMHDALLQKYGEPKADIFTEGQGILGWWDNWARIAGGDASSVKSINADASHMAGGYDAGSGPWYNAYEERSRANKIKMMQKTGIKAGVWIECQGDSGTFILAFHQNEDGTLDREKTTGLPRMTGFAWTWNSTAPGAKAESNYVAWTGMHSFVNNEDWAYPYVLSEYPQIAVPTYPDGREATGYLEGGDRTTPELAVFYDACACKDLFGNTFRAGGSSVASGHDTFSPIFYDREGKEVKADILTYGKDVSAPFWTDYTRYIVDYFVGLGAEYFWIDNWNGWDNIGNFPIDRAFGDWSEYKFREYLQEHKEIKVKDRDNFSITEYLKTKAGELSPECDINNYSDYVWKRKEWVSDPVWMAYLSFKAKENIKYNSAMYESIKEAGEKYFGDRDAVAGEVNDFPYLTYAAWDCEKTDIISCEYNDNYSAGTGFNTNGFLPNRYSGHAFALLSNSARSHNAVIWYYASTYPYTDTNGQVMGYEALAFNCLLSANDAGTVQSNKIVNADIGTLKEYLSDRRLYAEIGIMYSPDSEMAELAPGGFVCAVPNTHDVSYMGWCQAFDELNIPYRPIQYQRIAEQINDCSVLILPNVLAIDQKTVDDVFIPWIKAGGTLVITGSEAGKTDSMQNNYKSFKKPILVKLANKYKNSRKYNVIYLEEDPCFEYFIDNKEYAIKYMAQSYLTDIGEMVNGWYEKGYLEKIFEIDMPLEASIITTLNYSQACRRFFVDIVNMQYDFKTDVLDPMPETVTVKVRIPSNYWGYDDLKVSVFNDGTGEVRQLEKGVDYTIDETYMTIKVNNIAYYATVMIELP
ncbi:MAG: hypothetical protein II748_02555, partial [Clostridia bacterium]|nr:hypothetical protein [Clostridia bacterium]